MPRNTFEREMAELKSDLISMGHEIDVIIGETVRVLREKDADAANAVRQQEDEINHMERRIEDSCVNIIALQQPLASDLRVITAALKIVTDMERISDQCYDICEILSSFSSVGSFRVPPRIVEMLTRAQTMFNQALESFVVHDVEKAYEVCRSDDAVDQLFSQTVLEVCATIDGRQTAVPQAVDYMFIAKYIERIADHCTNIAEWVIFIQTGAHPDLNNDKTE